MERRGKGHQPKVCQHKNENCLNSYRICIVLSDYVTVLEDTSEPDVAYVATTCAEISIFATVVSVVFVAFCFIVSFCFVIY